MRRRRRTESTVGMTGGPPSHVTGYSDLHLIGEGGASWVFRAHDLEFGGRLVALKVLKNSMLDEAALARFDQECALLGTLSAVPNIVVPLNRGVTDHGAPWLSMEYFPEGSLADRLRTSGVMPLDEVTAHLVGIAKALNASHGQGVLHRDVKPENVFARDGVTKLADFGISVRAGLPVSTETLRYTSPLHAAPETLEGRPPTIASDVYSLASTIYQLLNGYPPFSIQPDESWQDAAVRLMRDDPPPPARHDIPGPALQVLMDALAKDPSRRPPTALEFARRFADAASPLHADKERPPVALVPPPFHGTAPPKGTSDTPASTTHVPGAAFRAPADVCAGGEIPQVALRDRLAEHAERAPVFETPDVATPKWSTTDSPGSGFPLGGVQPDVDAGTVARPLASVEVDEVPAEESSRSPALRGAIIGGVVASVLLVLLLVLAVIAPSPSVDPDEGPEPSIPSGSEEIEPGDPELIPANVQVEAVDENGLYRVTFEDRSDGESAHQVVPAAGGSSSAKALAPGESEVEVIGSSFECVFVVAMSPDGTMSWTENETCAP